MIHILLGHRRAGGGSRSARARQCRGGCRPARWRRRCALCPRRCTARCAPGHERDGGVPLDRACEARTAKAVALAGVQSQPGAKSRSAPPRQAARIRRRAGCTAATTSVQNATSHLRFNEPSMTLPFASRAASSMPTPPATPRPPATPSPTPSEAPRGAWRRRGLGVQNGDVGVHVAGRARGFRPWFCRRVIWPSPAPPRRARPRARRRRAASGRSPRRRWASNASPAGTPEASFVRRDARGGRGVRRVRGVRVRRAAAHGEHEIGFAARVRERAARFSRGASGSSEERSKRNERRRLRSASRRRFSRPGSLRVVGFGLGRRRRRRIRRRRRRRDGLLRRHRRRRSPRRNRRHGLFPRRSLFPRGGLRLLRRERIEGAFAPVR